MELSFEGFVRALTDGREWGRAGGAAIGQAFTQVPEQLAFNNARGIFGTLSDTQKLNTLQLIARGGLFLTEIGLGLMVAADGADDPVGAGGLAFAGAALLHAGIDAKDQWIGTGPVLGIQWG